MLLALGLVAHAAAAPSPPPCSNASFPHSLLGTQCYGTQHVAAATTAADCLNSCCNAESACTLWNFADGSHRAGLPNGCWIGESSSDPERQTHCTTGRPGWDGGSRDHAPTPPAPWPPPSRDPYVHMRGRTVTHMRGRRRRSHRRVGPTPTLVRPSHTSSVADVILTGAISLYWGRYWG